MLAGVETKEIAELLGSSNDQRRKIVKLVEERNALNSHLEVLEVQNLNLLDELEQHVRNGEFLTKTLDKKERMTDLKERLAATAEDKSPMRVTQTGFNGVSPLRYRHA